VQKAHRLDQYHISLLGVQTGRHNDVQTRLEITTKSAGVPGVVHEPSVVIPGLSHRPDALFGGWRSLGSRQLLVDVVITTTATHSKCSGPSGPHVSAGHAVRAAETEKARLYQSVADVAPFRAAAYAGDIFGFIGAGARDIEHGIALAMHTRWGTPLSSAATSVRRQMSVSLQNAVYTCLVKVVAKRASSRRGGAVESSLGGGPVGAYVGWQTLAGAK